MSITKYFDFGSRPIQAIHIESRNIFRFVHNKEGWIIAELTPRSGHPERREVDVWDAEGDFMGSVIGLGNISTLVSQIYDQQYGPDTTPIKPDQIWVVFAKISDGFQEANFSREVNAPDLETAKETFLSEATQGADTPPLDITLITIYGPYMRA